jgi:hypothetical protein
MVRFTEEEIKSKTQNDLPAGEYNCRVSNAYRKTFSTGTPAIEYILTVIGGEYGNTTLFYSIAITDKTKGILAGFLKSCGIEGLTSREVNEIDEPINRKCIAILEDHEYNGEVYKRVKRCKPFIYSGKDEVAEKQEDNIAPSQPKRRSDPNKAEADIERIFGNEPTAQRAPF